MADLLAAARLCLKRISFSRRLRLLGVRTSSLCDPAEINAAGEAQGHTDLESEPELDDFDDPSDHDIGGRPKPGQLAASARQTTPARPHKPLTAAEPELRSYTLPLFDDEP
jgi:hypothetical protein